MTFAIGRDGTRVVLASLYKLEDEDAIAIANRWMGSRLPRSGCCVDS